MPFNGQEQLIKQIKNSIDIVKELFPLIIERSNLQSRSISLFHAQEDLEKKISECTNVKNQIPSVAADIEAAIQKLNKELSDKKSEEDAVEEELSKIKGLINEYYRYILLMQKAYSNYSYPKPEGLEGDDEVACWILSGWFPNTNEIELDHSSINLRYLNEIKEDLETYKRNTRI